MADRYEYAYDDYMPPDFNESLYDKYTQALASTYANNDFVRGASDEALYQSKKHLDLDSPRTYGNLIKLGAGLPTLYYINKYGDKLSIGENAAIGAAGLGLGYLASQGINDKTLGPEHQAPQGDGFAYNAGRKAVPASLATGTGLAFSGKSPLTYLPFFTAPMLAGMVNPSFAHRDNYEQYIDKDK